MTLDVFAMRRDLHRHPELGFTEFRTASLVTTHLSRLGYDVSLGAEALDADSRLGVPDEEELTAAYDRALAEGAEERFLVSMRGGLTAVVATLDGNRPGPTVALRFDMDALPVRESEEATHAPAAGGYGSRHPGTMHACGHDGHTAIGLAVAETLSDRDFAGTVRLLFQPAEEGGRGGYAMARGGAVEGVERLFCMHLGMGVQVGEICASSQGFFANSKLHIRFSGKAAHASAAPEAGKNALLGAATALLNIHAIPRFSTAPTRVNVGMLRGGTTPNVVAAEAELSVETRSTDTEVNEQLSQRVREIVMGAARMHDLDVDIQPIGQAAAAVCDAGLIEEVMRTSEACAGISSIKQSCNFGASEDATFLMRRVQEQGGSATYMVIGASNPAPHHSADFDIDERALPIAVELLEKLVGEACGADTYQP